MALNGTGTHRARKCCTGIGVEQRMGHEFPVRGFNECLIMYILASSDTENYPVSPAVYHRGWAQSNFFKNGKQFYGHTLPLGFDYGGPLFFSQYSFLGLDPRGLKRSICRLLGAE